MKSIKEFKVYTTFQKGTKIISMKTDFTLSRGIFVMWSLNMGSVIVYKMKTYFRELEIERGSILKMWHMVHYYI
jgi:hypothetical protein